MCVCVSRFLKKIYFRREIGQDYHLPHPFFEMGNWKKRCAILLAADTDDGGEGENIGKVSHKYFNEAMKKLENGLDSIKLVLESSSYSTVSQKISTTDENEVYMPPRAACMQGQR